MENVNDFYIYLSQNEKFVIPAIVTLIAIVLTLLYLTCRSSSKGRCVLISGICDSGKTVLYTRLVNGKFVETYTSIKENVDTYKVKNSSKSPLALVDLPGHERLRTEYLEKYKGKTRALVYVIDSSTVQKEIKDVSQYLFTILTHGGVTQGSPALLVACNKSDVALAKSAKVIQTMLEKEITLLNVTQSAMLESTGDSGSTAVTCLGKQGQDFTFNDLRMKVDFCECSARGDKEGQGHDLKAVTDWLAKVA